VQSSASSQPLRPFDARMIAVGDGHWIYVEEFGKRGGRPVVFLHGGPGSGAQHAHRALFDAERDHAFLLDQRGAGRSHPYLSCVTNTTQHLIEDLEVIRAHFGISRWTVVGGSWGSTLAVAYAESYPERVSGLVLRAIFLGTMPEVVWAFVDGPKTFRPDLFAQFRDWLPVEDRADVLTAYVRRLTHPDDGVRKPAALIWNAYERILSELSPSSETLPATIPADARLPPTPIVEAHYIANDFFLKPGQLLAAAGRLAGVPGTIVQGRYDLLCPPAAAAALAAAWPQSTLKIVANAGHAMTEPGIFDAMRTALRGLNT
jgi:proline iminopeptidase